VFPVKKLIGAQVPSPAGSTKREPIVVGKPAEFMLENIATQFGLQRNQICMVGDRLDTDILFGKNGGLATALVLSGEWVQWGCDCAGPERFEQFALQDVIALAVSTGVDVTFVLLYRCHNGRAAFESRQ
jgi:ribonucleotide monophosphatase NagD (HAD superfamily)